MHYRKFKRFQVSKSDIPLLQEPISTAGNISSRKNLWESGRVGGSSGSIKRKNDEVTGAGFSSRRDQWLKVTQQDTVTKKSVSWLSHVITNCFCFAKITLVTLFSWYETRSEVIFLLIR